MKGLSLDLSRKSSGIAVWVGDQPVKVETIALPKGFLGEQLAEWEQHVERMFLPDYTWVAYEDARAVSKQHGMILFGMTGMVLAECWKRGIPALGFAQTTVKKALTGSGKSDKSQMLEAARIRWPHLGIKTDDEADALGVGLAFWATQG